MPIQCLTQNHTMAALEEREKLHFPEEAIGRVLHELRGASGPGLSECLLLCTCNRTELYFVAERSVDPAELRACLTGLHGAGPAPAAPMELLRGYDAVLHLFRVASGLESLILGENEILGQLKTAFRLAAEAGSNGFFTNACVHRAFRVAKRVRTETRLCSGGTSIGTVAVEHAERDAGALGSMRILVAGGGEVADLALRAARARNPRALTVIARRPGRARPLGDRHGARVARLENMPAELAAHDIVFSATASPNYIIHPGMLPAAHPLRIYDLALPRDVDPAVADCPGVTLRNVDDLHPLVSDTMAVRAAEVPRVEAIIAEAMTEYRTWLHELAAVPSIQRLLALSRAICDEEIERIRRTGLATGPEALDLVGNHLINALMRTIIEELKETARSASEAHGSGDLTRLGRGLGKDHAPEKGGEGE